MVLTFQFMMEVQLLQMIKYIPFIMALIEMMELFVTSE